jgi:DNA-binding SARP family transcriptional activator
MYRLRLLGEPGLEDRTGRPLPLGPVATALLALLVRAPELSLGRERAAALLWPDADTAAARRALRQLLFRTRAELPGLLDADRTSVRIDAANVGCDVIAFVAAAENGGAADAAQLYAAPFLDGFTLAGCAELEHWADRERARLQRVAAAAFEQVVDDAVSRGRWHDALAAAERWLAAEPYSERAASCAIAATAQLGDATAAVARFDAFRERLARELDAPPPRALQQLVQRIRRGAFAGASAGPAAPAARAMASPAGAELPYVGREVEHARLSACWRRAQHGSRQLVVLRGEPGIGKTRLAAEFARWSAALGATVLATRAWEVESAVPYAALAGALRDALHAPGLAGVEARTLAELGRVVPEYTTRFAAAVAPADTTFETGRLRFMDACRDLLDSLAHEAPVLLVVDDVPHADDATIATLHYVWRSLADVPLMIVATARGTAAAELRGAERFVAAVQREQPDACTTLRLGPLPGDAIDALLRDAASPGDRRADSPAAAPLDARVLELRTGGNPLFISELLRAAADGRAGSDASETIRLIARDRTAALEDGARALLHAAAVLGRQFPLPVAGAMANLEGAPVARAVDALVARGLIRQVAYGYDFVHDVVREAVLAELGAATRRLLHARAFEQLRPAAGPARGDEDGGDRGMRGGRARGSGPDNDGSTHIGAERAGALAHHAEAAGLRADAHHWHLRAARAAIALYAPAEAGRALARALEHADTNDERRAAWVAIAELARARTDFRGAAYAYQQALAVAGETAERVRLKLRMLHMGERAGVLTLGDVETLAGELRADAERAGREMLAELRYICADAASRAGELDAAARHAAAAAAGFRHTRAPRPLARALLLHAVVSARRGDGDALALLDEAERIAVRHDLHPELLDVRIEQATELSRLGRWDEAIVAFGTVMTDARRGSDWSSFVIACVNAADLRVRRGAWDDARAGLAEVADVCQRFDFPHVAVVAALNGALLEWLQGNGERAREHARRARVDAETIGLRAPGEAAAAIEALVLLDAGRVDEAAALIAHAHTGTRASHPTWSDDAELVVCARARLLAARGHDGAAIALLDEVRAATREPYAAALLACEQAALLGARSARAPKPVPPRTRSHAAEEGPANEPPTQAPAGAAMEGGTKGGRFAHVQAPAAQTPEQPATLARSAALALAADALATARRLGAAPLAERAAGMLKDG